MAIPLDNGVPEGIDRIKLAVFDVDGTLARDDSQVSDNTIAAMRELHDAGMNIVVATGRPAYLGASLFERAGIDGYVVGANGAMTIHTAQDEPVFVAPLERSLYERMCAFAREHGATMFTFTDDAIWASHDGPGYDVICAVNVPYEVRVTDVLALDRPAIKTMFGIEPERMAEFKQAALAEFPQTVETLPCILEQASEGITKWSGLQPIFEALGVTPDEVLGVGDSENDIVWMPYVGISLAMGNAYDSLLSVSQYQIRDNESDGVAHFMRDWAEYLRTR